MDVVDAIKTRRAYRSLKEAAVTEELIRDLAHSASLAPSCYNKQPWRFVFVHDPNILKDLHAVFSRGNEWCRRASMVIAVFTRKDLDCNIKEREYYLFDTGMATAFLILRATELGLVAHPIAGYDPEKVREVLGIPEDMLIITLIIVGKHASEPNPLMTEWQIQGEQNRPPRKHFEEFAYINKYSEQSL